MNEEIYSLLLKEIKRLRGEVELEPIFKEYIYDYLTDQEVLEILKTDTVDSINLPSGLKHPAVLKQTILLIDALQKCDTWQQFEKWYTPPKREAVNFNQLIDHLLKTKPPE